MKYSDLIPNYWYKGESNNGGTKGTKWIFKFWKTDQENRIWTKICYSYTSGKIDRSEGYWKTLGNLHFATQSEVMNKFGKIDGLIGDTKTYEIF